MRFFLRLFYMFHLRYSNCRPLNSARYNRIICQTVQNTSFFERLSCILHALANGYQGYKSNFGFHVPFDREIWQIQDQKSVFGFAEKNTPTVGHVRESNRSSVIFMHGKEKYVLPIISSYSNLAGFQCERKLCRYALKMREKI